MSARGEGGALGREKKRGRREAAFCLDFSIMKRNRHGPDAVNREGGGGVGRRAFWFGLGGREGGGRWEEGVLGRLRRWGEGGCLCEEGRALGREKKRGGREGVFCLDFSTMKRNRHGLDAVNREGGGRWEEGVLVRLRRWGEGVCY